MGESLLSIIIFSPILGLVIIPLIKSETTIKWISLFVTLLSFLLSIPIITGFDPTNSGLQFVHKIDNWIRISDQFSIHYHFGLDGVALLLFVLTSFLFFLSSAASWTYIHKRVKEFHISLLLLEIGVLGVFASANLVLFYDC